MRGSTASFERAGLSRTVFIAKTSGSEARLVRDSQEALLTEIRAIGVRSFGQLVQQGQGFWCSQPPFATAFLFAAFGPRPTATHKVQSLWSDSRI